MCGNAGEGMVPYPFPAYPLESALGCVLLRLSNPWMAPKGGGIGWEGGEALTKPCLDRGDVGEAREWVGGG